MTLQEEPGPSPLMARIVLDSRGKRVGVVGRVYVEDPDLGPAFVTVDMAPLGLRHAVAPLQGSSVITGKLQLSCVRRDVRHAPKVPELDHQVSDADVRLLRTHYGI